MKNTSHALEIIRASGTDIGTLLFVGTYKYYLVLHEHLQNGTCPFCQIDTAVNRVLFENESWRAWENPVPGKKHQALHLVIPLKRHATHASELLRQEWGDFQEVIAWATDRFEITGGGIVMRFGNPMLNAGTVRHLHVNIQVPSGTGKLDVTLAKDPDKVERHRKIIGVFEQMRQGTQFKDLLPHEQELVRDRLG